MAKPIQQLSVIVLSVALWFWLYAGIRTTPNIKKGQKILMSQQQN